MADEIIAEFLIESRDNLDLLDRELVALEVDPRDQARLASVFRTVHTIKGTAGFLQFEKLQAVAHVGENLLSRLRSGTILLEAVRTSALLAMIDAVRTLLDQIEANEREGDGDYRKLCEALTLTLDDATLSDAQRMLDGQQAKQAHKQADTSALDAARESDERAATDPRVRVDVRLLDRMMNLVGELVLARNRLLQHTHTSADAALAATCQHMNLITTELQESVMRTRMQPIENVWNRLPRMVRDVALQCGKQVRLELEGAHTELDRTIIEAIGDPLTHLVRNSIDHGIEAPSRRQQLGKDASGTLRLRAYHEGGRVNIEVTDDGQGIDAQRVLTRAVERGMLTAERARSLTSSEVHELLFAPGFSTAEKVTNVSGRGVGLDVVRSNIERLGGSVDIESTSGQGTSFRIRIPLTLAIIPALLVGAGGERFALPQASLVELMRLEREQLPKLIERIQGVPVYRLRGQLLPLVSLCELFRLPDEERDRDLNLIVLQADDRRFGLLVDAIFDTEEIVVKPLGAELRGLNTYAGATILGDGRVALILDIAGLAEHARVSASVAQRASATASANERRRKQLLLFRSCAHQRMAVSLADVARLEEIPRARVEHVAGEDVVQYRGDILPLIHLAELFGGARTERDLLRVLVHHGGAQSVGFVVDAIDDVVEVELGEPKPGRVGTRGSAVIQGKVTEIVDLAALRAMGSRAWGAAP